MNTSLPDPILEHRETMLDQLTRIAANCTCDPQLTHADIRTINCPAHGLNKWLADRLVKR